MKRKSKSGFLCAARLTLLILVWSLGTAGAAKCLENKDYYQNLPAVIGKEDRVDKAPFLLKCDTVFVRRGVTTVVYPGTLLYFANPTLNSVIKVEGTLLIKGTKNSYVTLAGSMDSTRNGIEPGNRQWGGIEVAEGGSLEVNYGGFMQAPTPITAFSSQVKIVNAWFKGSTGIILPDGGLYKMESKWHAVNNLDLSKGNTDQKDSDRPADAISQKEKSELLNTHTTGFWTWKKIAGGAAAVVVVGVGAGVLMAPEKTPTTKTPTPPEKLESTLEPFTLELPSGQAP